MRGGEASTTHASLSSSPRRQWPLEGCTHVGATRVTPHKASDVGGAPQAVVRVTLGNTPDLTQTQT